MVTSAEGRATTGAHLACDRERRVDLRSSSTWCRQQVFQQESLPDLVSCQLTGKEDVAAEDGTSGTRCRPGSTGCCKRQVS